MFVYCCKYFGYRSIMAFLVEKLTINVIIDVKLPLVYETF